MAGACQNRGSQTSFLLEQGREKVLDIDLLVAGAYGFALGRAERFLSLFRKPIHIHKILLLSAHPGHVPA